MVQQIIDIGTSVNDGTGDTLRDGMDKVNDNFTEIYTNTNAGTNVSISGNTITTVNTNGDLILDPVGTGSVLIPAPLTITGVATVTGNLIIDQITINGNNISTNVTNADLELTPIGTGAVVITSSDLNLNNNNITSGGTITATSFVGALTGNATTATSATTAGTVTTAAQSSITSVGSLTTLTMAGAIAMGTNDITGGGTATFTNFAGTLTTAAQANVTSLGTLTSLTSSGDIDGPQLGLRGNNLEAINTNGDVQITPAGTGTIELQSTTNVTGNLVATGNLGGTLLTATQPNITSVGSLTALTMAGDVAMGANDITSTGSIGGTLSTAAQPNITSIGNLTTLNVGQITVTGGIISSNTTNADIQLAPTGTGTIDLTLTAAAAGTPANFSAAEYIAIKVGGITKYIPLATVTW